MTEYIIIIALIAIAAIGVYSFFGQTVRQDPSAKAVAKDSAPAQPAPKSDPKGAADSKSAGVTK
jgi:Flp pilus assembly protein CpaB